MRAYIATKISNANNGIKLGYKLQKLGIEITSRWLECEGDERPEVSKEERGKDARWRKFAEKWCKLDLEDVEKADCLIILATDDGTGTWVEFGYAIGLRKPIYYVGDQKFTVFCHLDPTEYPIKYFDKSESLAKYLSSQPAPEGFDPPPGFVSFDPPAPDLYSDVVDFHDKFGVPFSNGKRDRYEIPSPELQELKFKHIQEEFDEYKKAVAERDAEGALDALVDLTYVVLGSARAHNFPFNQAWRRVHAKNMTKRRALKASESKRGSAFDIVKPEGWTPARLNDLLEADLQAGTKVDRLVKEEL